MNVGIIGAGLIGNKRAEALAELGDNILGVADVDKAKAERLADKYSCKFYSDDYKKLLNLENLDAVVVSTTHNNLAKISLNSLKHGKHVLCEKPLGINTREVKKCLSVAKKQNLVYKPGYNHRFHPGLAKAYVLYKAGKIGKIMFIKATLGHGGRPGYENEWRFNPALSGGGELIDQGAHLVDLSLWFMGDIRNFTSVLTKSFWKSEVEDNAFLLLTSKDMVAQIHASWTEWKNRFVYEVYGKKGYLKVVGLGGSYGVETLTFGQRVPGAAPKKKTWEFNGKDISWAKEWEEFKRLVKAKNKKLIYAKDGLAVLEVIEQVYKKDSKN